MGSKYWKMKVQRIWIVLVLLAMASFSAWSYPPSGYPGPVQGQGLGVRVADMAFPELEQLGLEYGVRVLDVAPQGPAAEAGLLPGDVVLGLNGSPVYSVARLRWLVRDAAADQPVTLELSRRGEKQTLQVRLASRPGEAPPPRVQPGLTAPPARTYLGVQLQELTEDLREVFGAPQGRGVLIAGVIEDGPAGQAGLKAGDLIVKLDRKAISGIEDVHRALAYFDPGEQVQLGIIRNAEQMEVTVTLSEHPGVESEAGAARDWQDPETWKKMLPPPEYWRRMMDEMMRSLEESWGDLRDRWSEDGRQYY